MKKYVVCSKIGEGSFSEVLKAKVAGTADIAQGSYVAIKRLRIVSHKTTSQSAQKCSTPAEVDILRRLNPHPHIIQFIDAFHDRASGKFCIVTELMDTNLYDYVQRVHTGQPLPEITVKLLMWQMLSGLAHVHRHKLFHRDIKPENLLVSNVHGKYYPLLKLADFGGCREVLSPPPYTEYIATRWYRAPECLLTNGFYSSKMDLWSVGCVMYELLAGKPLFPGRNEMLQAHCIDQLLGPLPSYGRNAQVSLTSIQRRRAPSSSLTAFSRSSHQLTNPIRRFHQRLPHCSFQAIRILCQLLALDPEYRISAEAALLDSFFDVLRSPPPTASPSLWKAMKTPFATTDVAVKNKAKRFQFLRSDFYRLSRRDEALPVSGCGDWKLKLSQLSSVTPHGCVLSDTKKEKSGTKEMEVHFFRSTVLQPKNVSHVSDPTDTLRDGGALTTNIEPRVSDAGKRFLESSNVVSLFDTQTTAPSDTQRQEELCSEDTLITSTPSDMELSDDFHNAISPFMSREIQLLQQSLMQQQDIMNVDSSNSPPRRGGMQLSKSQPISSVIHRGFTFTHSPTTVDEDGNYISRGVIQRGAGKRNWRWRCRCPGWKSSFMRRRRDQKLRRAKYSVTQLVPRQRPLFRLLCCLGFTND